LLVGVILLAGCEINEPKMPTFTTSFTVPIGEERFEIQELVEDEEYLAIAPDGGISFMIEGDPDTMALDFDLAADIEAKQIEQGVGNFEISAGDPAGHNFGIAELWDGFPGGSGSIVVPAFTFDVDSPAIDTGDEIDSANLASGQLAVTITNDLTVPVSGATPPDQITVTLEDSQSHAVFATIVFPEIAAGDFATRTADLAGKTLPAAFVFGVSGGSAGSDGLFVDVDETTDGIDIEAAFTDLVVSQAVARIPAQSFATDFEMELPADYEITEAVIGAGEVELTLENDMAIPCVAVLTWLEVLDLDEDPLVVVFELDAGAQQSQTIDFANLIVTAPPGHYLTELTTDVRITSPGSGGDSVPLTADQGLQIDLAPGTLSFSSVTGLIPAEQIAIDPTTVEVDLPEEMDGISLAAATMTIDLVNGTGVSGEVSFVLTGRAESGAVETITANADIQPAINRASATTAIVLDENNSDIVPFLNNLPTEISLSGEVAVGGEVGTVYAGDTTVLEWRIQAPVEVVIDETTLTTGPEAMDFDDDTQDVITDHAGGAWFHTEINNHLPFAVSVTIAAAQDTLDLETEPLVTIGPLTVAAGEIDPETRTVSASVLSALEVELTAAEAKVFGLPGIYTQIDVRLPGTDELPVKLLSTDYLTVSGAMRLDVEINDQW